VMASPSPTRQRVQLINLTHSAWTRCGQGASLPCSRLSSSRPLHPSPSRRSCSVGLVRDNWSRWRGEVVTIRALVETN
jgi:hypothetical protein